ncbi:MAG TPA: hypothetical protein VKZ18_22230 [Polyangia bacterium]|nr:hypothetical protein [Polyangia bacterium]
MRSPRLLGTTWRRRATGEIAVVWRLSSRIYLIDVESIATGGATIISSSAASDPKYWVFTSQRALMSEWQQVHRGRIPIEP